ncbi:hypothetical protein GCM10010302_74410 [Streptomyces polychromogenes]|uniref:Uncharacterized protein n=1 Tax=Streptomyces polychromogenes TaxID=67342 RepID=A0ABN0W3W1_9ACTN
MATQPSVKPFSHSQLETLRQTALKLSVNGLPTTPVVGHREDPATAHAECPGCTLPSPITFRYGGPMADCRLCGYGWAVEEEGR